MFYFVCLFVFAHIIKYKLWFYDEQLWKTSKADINLMEARKKQKKDSQKCGRLQRNAKRQEHNKKIIFKTTKTLERNMEITASQVKLTNEITQTCVTEWKAGGCQFTAKYLTNNTIF